MVRLNLSNIIWNEALFTLSYTFLFHPSANLSRGFCDYCCCLWSSFKFLCLFDVSSYNSFQKNLKWLLLLICFSLLRLVKLGILVSQHCNRKWILSLHFSIFLLIHSSLIAYLPTIKRKILFQQTVLRNIKNNSKMCFLMYFKIQNDQPRITQNALKSQIFNLFTRSSSGHKYNFSLKIHYYTSFITSRITN